MAEFRVVIEGRIVYNLSRRAPDEAEKAGQDAIADAALALAYEGLQLVDARVTDIQRVDRADAPEGEA